MHPNDQTPEGVWDLAGNVWEWTSSKSSGGWYWLMGGSWDNDGESVGSAARDDGNPWVWFDDRGFRVVVVPISRSQ